MSAIVWSMAAQGTDAWKAARRGAITGSKAKLTRAFKRDGQPEAAMLAYAMDLARERLGGTVAEVYVNAAMRTGTEQEPFARLRYEARTGAFVDEVGFAHTFDGKFGCSVDGLVLPNGGIEVKTIVSSATLFKAMVDGDISEYRDQCLFALWLLSLAWVDVCLWCPDLELLRVIRIERDEAEIQALESDLLAFDTRVEGYRAALSKILPDPLTGDVGDDTTPLPLPDLRADEGADMDAPWALPTSPIDRPRAVLAAAHQANLSLIRNYLQRAQQPEMTAERIAAGIEHLATQTPSDEWEEFTGPALAAQVETLQGMRTLHAQAVAREAEAARLELQRVENARVAAELAVESKRLAEEAAAVKALALDLQRNADARRQAEEFTGPALAAQVETLQGMRTLQAQAVSREAEAARQEAIRRWNRRARGHR